ncbi:hypothetical protein HS99_0010055 [Kitasatospora aureofaciens]|uniref:Uncharacterized protein n=1 Tax=Kitasatospora aureofaciens TaxID=1894 RepID=A0A1E7N2A5_KITAU|nr:hypothetical protein [Kitasatospora aureofaciens]ARF81832.1 hypothetical protein B6264_25685 [Kitasatospora aureofaciens]OEV34806.1 hypothetical protein HS99_0010055 [Kitasatospora aureofaciens]GGU92623.1 hypothetical protein GCM10010502_52650 [Kitasatospora aureofaciens]
MAAALHGRAAASGARLSLAPVTAERGRRRWQWALELNAGPGHDTLLTVLTDSRLPLGLELWRRECTCGQPVSAGCALFLTRTCTHVITGGRSA